MTGTMQAAVLQGPGEIRIEQVPIPQPGPGEVRVKVEGCGVCASNVEPWEGQPWSSWPGAPGGSAWPGGSGAERALSQCAAARARALSRKRRVSMLRRAETGAGRVPTRAARLRRNVLWAAKCAAKV